MRAHRIFLQRRHVKRPLSVNSVVSGGQGKREKQLLEFDAIYRSIVHPLTHSSTLYEPGAQLFHSLEVRLLDTVYAPVVVQIDRFRGAGIEDALPVSPVVAYGTLTPVVCIGFRIVINDITVRTIFVFL